MAQALAKQFLFNQYNYLDYTFSDSSKITINNATGRLELKEQGVDHTGEQTYSTDTDLTCTTPELNPQALKQWLGFSTKPRPSLQPANTSIRYKLNDGTDDRYWDGGAWAVAGATDWNDESTVVTNIGTYPVTSKKLSLVINLVTTDEYYTPSLARISLLMSCEMSYLQSLVSDTLIPSLRSYITPTIDRSMRAPGGTYVSLRDIETAFNISSIDAVYDHTSDPNHVTDLLSSYDSTSKTITLSSAVDRGNILWLRVDIEPEIYLNFASQDYLEVEKLPAVVIDSFVTEGNEIAARQWVTNINDGSSSVRRFPFRLSIEFEILLLAEKSATLLNMMDKAFEHAARNPLLNWLAIDENVSMKMITEGTWQSRPNLRDKHSATYTLRLDEVYLWVRPEESLPTVQTMNITLDNDC